MKKILFISSILCCTNISSINIHLPIAFQPYIGISRMFTSLGGTNLLQTGLYYNPKNTILFIQVENNLHHLNHKYDWPGVGPYKYQRHINNTVINFGVNLFKRKRFSALIGIGYNYTETSGKLISNNETIKRNISKGYFNSFHKASICATVSYRIKNFVSVYANYHGFEVADGYRTTFIGLGLGYNFLSEEL
ncbi:MAG: hypothetical protein R2852_05415 [Bacteroidia bacterium]